jgi:autotransporter translocation and assembly factor TamB
MQERRRSRFRRAGIAGGIVVAVALLVFLFRGPILSELVAEAASIITGTRISFASLQISSSHLRLRGVRITTKSGDPIATIARVDVGFDLHDLMTRTKRQYGLRSVSVVDPNITIIRYQNGMLNVPLPKPSAAKPSGPPFIFTANVSNGSLTVNDRTRVFPVARHIAVSRINANADVNTLERTRYSFSMAYLEGGRAYPVRAGGTIDQTRGFELQRIVAKKIPLAQLVDYVVNNRALRVKRGDLVNFDVRAFALRGPGKTLHPQFLGTLGLRGGVVRVSALTQPLVNLHGTFDVAGTSVTTRGIAGSIGGITEQVTGGVYGLPNPQVRFTMRSTMDLSAFRQLTAAARRLPISGPVSVRLLVEGPALAPEAFIDIDSPRFTYNGIPLTDTGGLIAVNARRLDILSMRTHEGAIALHASGRVAFVSQPNVLRMIFSGDAPASSLPFASGFVPRMTLRAAMLATAMNFHRIDTRGVIFGKTSSQIASGIFDIASNGTGTVGPIFAGNRSGSLYARIDLDHPHAQTLALIDARNFHVASAPRVPLGNFRISPIPPFSGTLDATLIGVQSHSSFGALGKAAISNARLASLYVNLARATLDGSIGDLEIPTFSANGPWGSIAGSGTLATAPDGMAAQLRNARLMNARGTTLASLDMTAGMQNGTFDIYAARARMLGGEAFAAGSVGKNANLSAWGASPLASGAVTVAGALSNPTMNGTFVIAGARVAKARLGGAASLALSNGRLAIDDAVARAGPAILTAQGTVTGLHAPFSMSGIRYDIAADVPVLDLQQAASMMNPKLASQVTGSAAATLRAIGVGRNASFAAAIAIPEGTLHGEGFRDLRFNAAGNSGAIALRDGTVTLGSSTITFNGQFSRAASQLALQAPRLNLADFNDFFDPGDMFEGHGHLDVAFAMGGAVNTRGSAAFTGTRLRQFDFGTTSARWDTTGSRLHLQASALSSIARLQAHGNISLPPIPSGSLMPAGGLRGALTSTNLNLDASARRVAIGSWLPLFGVTAPITGTARLDAAVHGRYPNLAITTSGSVTHATAGRMPVRSLTFAGNASGMHGTLRSIRLSMPYLSASGAGTFGLAPTVPFDLHAVAMSPNIGSLARTATGKKSPISGAAAAHFQLRGTMKSPSLDAQFTLSSLRYAKFSIPRVSGSIVANRTSIALQRGEADFRPGRLVASGKIPFRLPQTRTRAERVALDPPVFAHVAVSDLGLSNFAPFMPAGSKLSGRIDGIVGLNGTTSAPRMNGMVTLAGGAYSGPFDKDPLDGMSARVALAGNTINVRSVRATVGSGTFGGSGRIVITNPRNPSAAAFNFDLSATHATVNSPNYLAGQIDAHVTAAHSPGRPITVGGNVALSHATIPVSALYHPSPKNKPAPALPNVAFDNFGISVGPQVRILNSSVDVSGSGAMQLNGTLAKPSLAGAFVSTGGTLNFYQLFHVQYARVDFSPSGGIMPYVNAVATTSIADPPTDVTIHVTGPATNMDLGLSSDPAYDRSQILGLLVGMQSFGAVEGVPSATSSSPFTAQSAFQRVGFGAANSLFTRSILQPAETQLGGALGLSNLSLYSNLGSGYGTGIGASVAKRIAQHVTMTTTASIGYPRREEIRFLYLRKNYTSAEFRIYQQQQTFLNSTPPLLQQGPGGLNLQPSSGLIDSASSGYVLSIERRYWACGFFHFCTSESSH